MDLDGKKGNRPNVIVKKEAFWCCLAQTKSTIRSQTTLVENYFPLQGASAKPV
jgi:hypothetical protein